MGFAEENVIVYESPSSNKTISIPLRIAKGNVTELPLVLMFIVENSSTAIPGDGEHHVCANIKHFNCTPYHNVTNHM